MENPKVSIIIPVYSGSNYLLEAIDSALGQTYQNCEVIVVNDGSNDGNLTEAIALSYGDKIRYYKKENGGVATALNLGIEKMTGDYFSWLSHDDLYYEDKIEIQIKALSKTNEYKIAYSDYTLWETETNVRSESEFAQLYNWKDLNNGLFIVWMAIVHGCTLLIHKSYFEKVGMFNPQLETTQDHEMWFRIFEEANPVFISKSLVIARRHKEQGSKTNPICYKERTALFTSYLNSISKDKKIEVFGSEYRFYSLLLEQFRISELYDCMKIVINKLLELEQPNGIEQEIEEFQVLLEEKIGTSCRNFSIWGGGYRGKLLHDRLTLRNIKIVAFIDNNPNIQGEIIDGIPCISPNDVMTKDMSIIISLKDTEEIEEQIKKLHINHYIGSRFIEKHLYQTGILKVCVNKLGERHALD